MPLQATFVADFSKWDKALADAQKGLKSFEVSGKGVQRQLEQMSKSFSGVNIKKEADLAVASVKAIGGASKLTEQEQKKLNATLTEALAKYRALGQTAPAELRKLHAETASVAKSTSLIGSAAARAGALLAGAFTVGAIVNVSRKVLELGGELSDLSAKTGIGVEALQEFKFAGGQVGVSLDAITSGINQMQNRIAEGDKSAVGALRRLNISLSDFKKLKPEDQFAEVAEAIGGIQDPAEKVRTAMDLMGKSGAELLPVLTQGFDDVRESARKMGIVLDQETVAALDTMGDRLDALQGVYLAGFARLLVEVQPLLEGLGSGLQGAGKWLDYLQDQFEFVIVGAYDLSASLADLEVSLYKVGRAVNPVAQLFGTFDAAMADAQARADAARLTVKIMSESIARDTTKAILSIAKAGEVRGVTGRRTGGDGGLAPSEEEIKRFQKWRDEVTGAATDKALAQLTKDWNALSEAERKSQPVRDAVMAQYEKLRVSLPKVGGALEDLRTANLRALQPIELLQRQLSAIASTAMPDAIRMFNAGQAAVNNLNRSGTLLSRTVIDLKDGMTAMPAILKSTAVAAADLKLQQQEAAESAERWRASLEDLAQAFALLGQIAPGTLSKIFSLLGKTVGSANLMVKSIDSMKAGIKGIDEAKGLGDTIAGFAELTTGILGAAAAAIEFGKALYDAFTKSRAEKTVERIGRELGIAVTEEFAQGIEDTAENIFSGNRQAARIFSLSGLIDQAGGLNSDNFKPLFAEFRALFSMVETGAFTAAQGVQVLDENFRTFAEFVTKGGSLASRELLEIIELTDRFGLKSAEVSAFVVQETNSALGGLTTFLQNASVKTQAAADGIGAALFGIFEAQTANGVPAAEIIRQLEPLIAQLDKQLKAAGLTGGAAFDQIKSLAAVASHEIAGPLITGVLGLEQALAGLHNSGVLNEEMFDGLTASVADTFAEILKTGVDGSKALQLIAPSLQTIWELSQDFGYTVDENTQKLLDEAEAAGLVGDEHRTATEQMLKLTERMTTAVEYLAQAFGYVTDEVDDLGNAISDLPEIPSARGIPDFESGGGSAGDYHDQYVPMAEGGIGTVTKPTLFLAGERGREDYAFSGANRSFSSGSGGGSTVNANVTLNVTVTGRATRRDGEDFGAGLKSWLQSADGRATSRQLVIQTAKDAGFKR